MNKKLLVFLPFLLILAGAFVSCEEVEEEGKYANWQERNQAYIDSIKSLVGNNYVATEEQALAIPVGEMFAILVENASTLDNPQYIYCKKIKANTEGRRPLYTQSTDVFYYGTVITGESFEGNFKGYSAADQSFSGDKNPTVFDAPKRFTVTGWIWTDPIQFMREGERWMLYVPWECGYGSSGSGSIPGYSVLGFDLQVEKVIQ